MTTDSELPSARVERLLPARPETVYDAWLNERSLKEFMCPAPGRVTEVAVDPQIGGGLRVVMTFPDRQSEITGEFLALDRPERVSFTWRTDAGDPESIVTVLLTAHGEDQTHMTIIHSRLRVTLAPSYLAGWTSIASRLGDHLAA